MVRVGGIQVGTQTAQGGVVSKDEVAPGYYVITFMDGSSRRFRYDQALTIKEG